MWLYGKGEKYGFLWVIGCRISSFHQKLAQKFIFINFKALKVTLLRQMRAQSVKQSCSSIKNLLFCFSDHARILRSKGTFGALKFKNPKKSAIFGANLPFWALSSHQNPFFSPLPQSHMSQLSYGTKISKKYGPWGEQWLKKQIAFFLKISPFYQAHIQFARLQKSHSYRLMVDFFGSEGSSGI